MNIKVSLDPVGYKSREEFDKRIGVISDRLKLPKNHKCINNITEFREFVEAVGNNGHAFAPINKSDNSRKDENYDQSYLFAVDFDNDKPTNQTTFKREFARSQQYNLPVLFTYETLRSKQQSRFRLVFLMDGAINEIKIAEFIMKALLIIFPNSDKSCGNVSRMYFGGKKLLYFNDSIPTIDVELIDIALGMALKEKHKEHYRRELQRFAKNIGLSVRKGGMLDIRVHEEAINSDDSKSGIILPTLLRYHREDDKKLPRWYELNFSGNSSNSIDSTEQEESELPYCYHKELRKDDIPKLREKCQLFREFENGDRWLWHNELFGLATKFNPCRQGKTVIFSRSNKCNAENAVVLYIQEETLLF